MICHEINFREIPQANVARGEQDSFELFSRDFLELIGYEIVSPPSRGRDGGKDMIVSEIRRGIGGVTRYKWLVSCKHHAFSGKSVNASRDETKIETRVRRHGCDGFIGFYSTLAETGLIDDLEGIEKGSRVGNLPFEFQIFDRENISTKLLTQPELQVLIEKYFPESYSSQQLSNFSVNLAMARYGKPYPIKFMHPTEGREIGPEEAMSLVSEANQVGFNPWVGEMFRFNNILGVTKSMRNGKLVDPTTEELERLEKAFEFQIQYLREHPEK